MRRQPCELIPQKCTCGVRIAYVVAYGESVLASFFHGAVFDVDLVHRP